MKLIKETNKRRSTFYNRLTFKQPKQYKGSHNNNHNDLSRKDAEMRKLAQAVIDAQQSEIEQMQNWIAKQNSQKFGVKKQLEVCRNILIM